MRALVPKDLSEAMMSERMMCSLDVLQQYQQFGQAFLDQIVTRDETWVFHKTAETKLQSSQWKHKSSPQPVKFKQTFSQQKIMATVFWDNKGVILVEFMDRGATINGDRYRQTLTNLRKSIKDRHPGKLSKGIQLLHDNARPHSAKATTELIANSDGQSYPILPIAQIWHQATTLCFLN